MSNAEYTRRFNEIMSREFTALNRQQFEFSTTDDRTPNQGRHSKAHAEAYRREMYALVERTSEQDR